MQTRVAGPREVAPLGPLDPRLAAWRADLADIELADRIAIPVYAGAVVRTVVAASAPLWQQPDDHGPMASELLHGERFALLDSGDGWGWGYAAADHYVGYVRLETLGPESVAGSQSRVGPGDALLFVEPSIKAPVAAVLPAAAQVSWRPFDARFVVVAAGPHAGRYLSRRHLMPAAGDWVDAALQFIGSPYRWGGRTRAGIDCSGLVQIARLLGGHQCRRDSDMQKADTVAAVTADAAQRGDLAFWPGHVGILLDGATLLHANAHWMRCVAEPLADAVDRAGAEPELRRPD